MGGGETKNHTAWSMCCGMIWISDQDLGGVLLPLLWCVVLLDIRAGFGRCIATAAVVCCSTGCDTCMYNSKGGMVAAWRRAIWAAGVLLALDHNGSTTALWLLDAIKLYFPARCVCRHCFRAAVPPLH